MSHEFNRTELLQASQTEAPSVLTITMNHGRVNEMGSAELRDWEAITSSLQSGSHRALVSHSTKVTRSGKPIFIAGANVTERVGWSVDQVKAHVRWQRETLASLRRAPAFHVTVVDGLALGWGTEFMITADYRIATPNARFALPETGIGILPGAGGTSELSRIVGPNQALRLGMTGEQIDAAEALRIGLIDGSLPTLMPPWCAREPWLSWRRGAHPPRSVPSSKACSRACRWKRASVRS